MKNDPEWNNSRETPLERESTTFASSESKNDDSEIEFENTSGLAKKYLNLTIGEIVRVRGGVIGMKEWASIQKILLSADDLEQKTRERRNELIEKDFAISNLKKYIDLFMEEVFNTAESQTEQIIALVLSDVETSRKEIPKMRMSSYTKISKSTKKSLKDSFKRLKKKYEESPDD